MKRRQLISAVTAGMALAGVHTWGWAQGSYPAKGRNIRLIVPFAAGGTTDIVARVVSDPMSRELGSTIVVENKGGGGGVIGALDLMRARPDGYTLGVATVSTTATNPAINPKVGYDPVKNFTPIVNLAATPNVIAVNPSFPAKNHEEFVAEIKKNPEKYSYASTGQGSITHMLMELYKSLTGLNVKHIPYRGAGPALNDVVAGHVPMLFDNLPSSLQFIQAGRLVPIAVAAPQRLAILPDVPTFKELGLEPVNRMAYYGLVGPEKLPQDVVQVINAAALVALKEPEVIKRIEDTGSMVIGNTPAEFAKQIQDEYQVYREVVEKQGLQIS